MWTQGRGPQHSSLWLAKIFQWTAVVNLNLVKITAWLEIQGRAATLKRANRLLQGSRDFYRPHYLKIRLHPLNTRCCVAYTVHSCVWYVTSVVIGVFFVNSEQDSWGGDAVQTQPSSTGSQHLTHWLTPCSLPLNYPNWNRTLFWRTYIFATFLRQYKRNYLLNLLHDIYTHTPFYYVHFSRWTLVSRLPP